MHELSIATSVLHIAEEYAQQEGITRIRSITLRVGELSSVHEQSLRFGFELVTQGTVLEGATLQLEHLPVIIYCPQCQSEKTLLGIQSFRCPDCQSLSGDIRQGRELDVESIEWDDPSLTPSS